MSLPTHPPVAPYVEDDVLLEATLAARCPRLRVYRPSGVAVVLGRGSRFETEVHLEPCAEDGVPVLRRRGGGCAVVLDPGNVVVAVTRPVHGLGGSLEHFHRLSAWIAAALGRLGIEGVGREGHSDLVLGDRKVGGACIYRTRDLLCYSTTLLVAPRIDLMERYLKHPPREPEYRRGRRHSEFVGRLGRGGGPEELAAAEEELRRELRLTELEGLFDDLVT
jgi:lipoate-protein ligase A